MNAWWRDLRKRAETWVTPRAPETLPVQLGRRRIYVLPTRFGLFFALLLLAMGLGALNYNNNPALLLMLLLAGAAHTSLLAAHLQLSGLGFNAIGAEPVTAGTPLTVRLHARAASGRERRGLRVDCEDASAILSLDDGNGAAEFALPYPPSRLDGSSTPAHFDHAPARPGARMGLCLAGTTVAGLSGAGNRRARRCRPAWAKPHRCGCTRPAMMSTTCARTVAAIHAARSHGSLLPAATACWFASTNNR